MIIAHTEKEKSNTELMVVFEAGDASVFSLFLPQSNEQMKRYFHFGRSDPPVLPLRLFHWREQRFLSSETLPRPCLRLLDSLGLTAIQNVSLGHVQLSAFVPSEFPSAVASPNTSGQLRTVGPHGRKLRRRPESIVSAEGGAYVLVSVCLSKQLGR